jgi:uncharacterized GH25 family protein
MNRLLLWLAAAPLFAHDLYMMPEKFVVKGGSQLKIVFQNSDDFPEASAPSPTKPERLRDTRLLSQAGTANLENIVANQRNTTATVAIPGEGLGIITARTLPTFLELPPDRFKSYLEHENLTSTLKWREEHKEANAPGRERYSKYVKSIIKAGKSDGRYKNPTGLTIEIIPEADPYSVKPGGTLPVQVLLRGKAAVDVAVESAWLENGKAKMEVFGRTDANGRIRIPVKAAGPHRLHAIVMERCAEPKVADWESFWASLTFEVQSY